MRDIRCQARCRTVCAVDVNDRATPGADEVVVVIADAQLEEPRVPRRFKSAREPRVNKVAERVINRLQAGLWHRHCDAAIELIGGGVRVRVQRGDDRAARLGDPEAGMAQERGGINLSAARGDFYGPVRGVRCTASARRSHTPIVALLLKRSKNGCGIPPTNFAPSTPAQPATSVGVPASYSVTSPVSPSCAARRPTTSM